MKEKIVDFLKFILIIFMFFFLGSLVVDVLSLLGFDTSLFDYQDYGYLEALLELLLAIVVLYLYRKKFKTDGKSLEKNYKYYLNEIFRYFALFLALKIVSSILTSVIGLILGIVIEDSDNQNTVVALSQSVPLMTLISTVILAPVVEEGIFRLGIRKIFKNNYLFILISGSIFGLMHIFPTDLSLDIALTYSITYLTMGFYLAYIYVQTDNIWVNIIVHALNNLLSMIAIFFIA
jgi:hypothetical protein